MILGIDYGRAKMGLARAEGSLADPWKVIRVDSFDDALKKIEKETETERPELMVVGVSEGAMGKEQEEFATALRRVVQVPVETWDEGLSTQDAEQLARESGKGPKKRREMEDAYAASVVLQSYLDGTQKSPKGN